MKNPSILLLALLISLAVSGCGKKESPPPTSPPLDTPPASNASIPMPEQAGPADLPPCPGFVSMEDAKGDSRAGSSILLSRQTGEGLLDAYTTDLLADGWIMQSSIHEGNQHSLQFRRGDRFLSFQLAPSDNPAGITRLHLAWGQAAGTGEIREAYEPEPEDAGPSNSTAGPLE